MCVSRRHDIFLQDSNALPSWQAPVLKGITFKTQSHEKIGLVGRTGARMSLLIVLREAILKLMVWIVATLVFTLCAAAWQLFLKSQLRLVELCVPVWTLLMNSAMTSWWTSLTRVCWAPYQDGFIYTQIRGSKLLGTQRLISLAGAMLNPSRILLLDEILWPWMLKPMSKWDRCFMSVSLIVPPHLGLICEDCNAKVCSKPPLCWMFPSLRL